MRAVRDRQATRMLFVPAVISLLTFGVYLAALRNGFINLDDDLYVYGNVHLRSFDWAMVRWAFTDMTVAFWHPVTWISHAIDCALWGLDPRGHHLTSVVLHAVNTLLAVLLMFRILKLVSLAGGPGRMATPTDGSLMAAAGVAGLLFGLHPLHVESVAWLSERKDILCAFFYLLGLLAYLGPAPSAGADPATGHQGAGRGNVLVALLLLILAAASKPMAMTFPAVLLILDWYPLGRIRSWRTAARAVAEKVPFFAVGVLTLVLAVSARNAMDMSVVWGDVASVQRLLIAIRSAFFYLGKMILPVGLSPYYPYPGKASLLTAEYAVPAVLAVIVLVVLIAGKRRWLAALGGYYAITLLPTLGQVQFGGQATADRYTYLPSLAPFLLVGIGSVRAWNRTSEGTRGPALRRAMAGAGLALLLALCYGTVTQIAVWKDSITLWSRVIEEAPGLAIAYNNRGVAYKDIGDLDGAIEQYTTAISLDPGLYRAYTNRGIARGILGDHASALDDLSMSLALNSSFAATYTSRGLIYERLGRIERAVADLTRAVELDPNSGEAVLNRGVAYDRAGRFELAIEDYSRALRLDPSDALAYRNRGVAFERMGKLDKAIEDHTRALSLRTDYAQAYLDRGECYRQTGNSAFAERDFRAACDLGSDVGCARLRR